MLGTTLVGLAGCAKPTEPADGSSAGLQLPEGIGEPAPAAADEATETGGAPRLRLRVEPARGRVPLLVRFEAELLGDLDEPADFECPTLAWTTDSRDDGEVVIAQATGCREGEVQRRFALEHAYLRARVYEASVRLVARDVAPSNLVQILAEGPTATPAAQVALPGPTIVVATPGRPLPTLTPSRSTTAAGLAEVDDGRDGAGPINPADERAETNSPAASASNASPNEAGATASTAAPPAPRPPTTRAPASSERARVLPADLYYLSGEPRSLWRLSAGGEPPEPIVEAPEAAGGIETFAISRNRMIAFTADGALRVGLAGREGALQASSVLTEAVATDLLWTRDGRRLSYAAEGVWEYDQRGRQQQRLLEAGRPLAWSREGGKLLALGPDGRLVLIDVEASPARPITLPIESIRSAGFFPDRDVAWLADEAGGLRLLSLDEDFSLRRVDFDAPVGVVRAAYVRPDRKLLSWVLRSGLAEAHGLDLLQGGLRARPLGAPIAWDDADALAWAPDGRLAAAAGPGGLRLLDPIAGSEVPLLRRAAWQPVWVLSAP